MANNAVVSDDVYGLEQSAISSVSATQQQTAFSAVHPVGINKPPAASSMSSLVGSPNLNKMLLANANERNRSPTPTDASHT